MLMKFELVITGIGIKKTEELRISKTIKDCIFASRIRELNWTSGEIKCVVIDTEMPLVIFDNKDLLMRFWS